MFNTFIYAYEITVSVVSFQTDEIASVGRIRLLARPRWNSPGDNQLDHELARRRLGDGHPVDCSLHVAHAALSTAGWFDVF